MQSDFCNGSHFSLDTLENIVLCLLLSWAVLIHRSTFFNCRSCGEITYHDFIKILNVSGEIRNKILQIAYKSVTVSVTLFFND